MFLHGDPLGEHHVGVRFDDVHMLADFYLNGRLLVRVREVIAGNPGLAWTLPVDQDGHIHRCHCGARGEVCEALAIGDVRFVARVPDRSDKIAPER
jgi:hypothetical protein